MYDAKIGTTQPKDVKENNKNLISPSSISKKDKFKKNLNRYTVLESVLIDTPAWFSYKKLYYQNVNYNRLFKTTDSKIFQKTLIEIQGQL